MRYYPHSGTSQSRRELEVRASYERKCAPQSAIGVSLSAEPLVSVVVPVFNGERHLEACLNSILGQTYQRIEVVVSVQDSTDRSVEIVRSFADPRLRLLPKASESLDLHANWARALEASTGEFVKLVCQDDILLTDCLSIQVELLGQHPTAVLACGRRRMIDDDDKVLIKARGLGHLAKSGTQVTEGSDLARACTRAGANLLGEPVNVLIRRSVLPQPLFDRRWLFAIDIEFYLRCLQDRQAVVDNRTVCCFRVSPHQLSAALAKGQAKELRTFFRELERRYPNDISDPDVRLGTIRAQLLALARRILYWQMRTRAMVVRLTRTDNDAKGTLARKSFQSVEAHE
jgi:glycosyltransferase involved in cell wall biosynthesis